jgi:hypothetical protein
MRIGIRIPTRALAPPPVRRDAPNRALPLDLAAIPPRGNRQRFNEVADVVTRALRTGGMEPYNFGHAYTDNPLPDGEEPNLDEAEFW